ncbi:MAG: sugar phosphate isomerase/epimerase family protein [Planctomycetota bacterium]
MAGCSAALAAALPRVAGAAEAAKGSKPHIACNHFPWLQLFRRDGRNFNADLDAGLAEVAQSGVDGFEPMITKPEDVDTMAPLLKKHGLEMRSLYINSLLHVPEGVDTSIANVMDIAERAKSAGTRIIVVNPTPIRWGGPENKDDQQIRTQAAALQKLGEKLHTLGLVLGYHNHDPELRNAAREFHHMMLSTNPKHMSLCLDAHWMYRGSGNSVVALMDIVKLYGDRVCEVHLRQSVNGTWTEAFGEGDIDYRELARQLQAKGVRPHIVLEQAPEKQTPKTMDAVEAIRRGRAYAEEVMGEIAA